MIYNKKHMAILALLLSAVYLKFFLVFPFFHHHDHAESANGVYHAHASVSGEADQHPEPGVQFIGQEEEHSHVTDSVLPVYLFPKRNQADSFTVVNLAEILPQWDPWLPENHISADCQSAILSPRERCVQSGANLSPPLV